MCSSLKVTSGSFQHLPDPCSSVLWADHHGETISRHRCSVIEPPQHIIQQDSRFRVSKGKPWVITVAIIGAEVTFLSREWIWKKWSCFVVQMMIKRRRSQLTSPSNLKLYFWGRWWIKKWKFVPDVGASFLLLLILLLQLPPPTNLSRREVEGGGGRNLATALEKTQKERRWFSSRDAAKDSHWADLQPAENPSGSRSSGWRWRFCTGWRRPASSCWCCVFITCPSLLLRWVQVTLTTNWGLLRCFYWPRPRSSSHQNPKKLTESYQEQSVITLLQIHVD